MKKLHLKIKYISKCQTISSHVTRLMIGIREIESKHDSASFVMGIPLTVYL